MKITKSTMQGVLVSIFLICLCMHFSGVFFLYVEGELFPDDTIKILTSLLKIYAIPLGVILAGIFARRKQKVSNSGKVPFGIALAVSLIWNILLLWRSSAYIFAEEPFPTTYISQLENLAGASGFLIGGALSYFFASE